MNQEDTCLSQAGLMLIELAKKNLRMAPTILRSGPYRVYFHSHEPNEPPHVHVDRDDQSAKFWLQPVSLVRNLGFGSKELNRIQRLLEHHEAELTNAWSEYHGT